MRNINSFCLKLNQRITHAAMAAAIAVAGCVPSGMEQEDEVTAGQFNNLASANVMLYTNYDGG